MDHVDTLGRGRARLGLPSGDSAEDAARTLGVAPSAASVSDISPDRTAERFGLGYRVEPAGVNAGCDGALSFVAHGVLPIDRATCQAERRLAEAERLLDAFDAVKRAAALGARGRDFRGRGSLVLGLDALDKGIGVIETSERDGFGVFIDDAVEAAGVESAAGEDVTLPWQEGSRPAKPGAHEGAASLG